MVADDPQEPRAYGNDDDGSTDETPLLIPEGNTVDDANAGELTYAEGTFDFPFWVAAVDNGLL